MILGFFVEECISIGFCIICSFYNFSLSGTKSDKLDFFFSLIIFSVLLLTLIFVTLLLQLRHADLESPAIKAKYNFLYEGLNIKTKLALLHKPIFIARRLLFMFIVVVFEDYMAIQVQSNFLCSLFVMMYLNLAKPIENKIQLRLEIFNEGVILMISYLQLLLTEYTPDA